MSQSVTTPGAVMELSVGERRLEMADSAASSRALCEAMSRLLSLADGGGGGRRGGAGGVGGADEVGGGKHRARVAAGGGYRRQIDGAGSVIVTFIHGLKAGEVERVPVAPVGRGVVQVVLDAPAVRGVTTEAFQEAVVCHTAAVCGMPIVERAEHALRPAQSQVVVGALDGLFGCGEAGGVIGDCGLGCKQPSVVRGDGSEVEGVCGERDGVWGEARRVEHSQCAVGAVEEISGLGARV